MTSAHRHLPLALILVGHVVLGIASGVATPLFEGPDEPNHFLFIRYLQVQRSLPVQGTDRNAVRAHHPPGYFLIGALLTAWVPVEGPYDALHLKPNPRYWLRFDDPTVDNKSLYLHFGPEEQWPYHGLALMVHLARLLSLAFSTLAVGFTYQLARQLRPDDDGFAYLATGLVAFNPMVLFMSGVVQNDAAALGAGEAVLYTLGRLVHRAQGFTFARWLVVGTVFSIAILLKASLLTLAAPIALVILYAARRAGQARALIAGGLGVLIPVVLFTGWWFVRNQRLYGDWTGNAAVVALWGALTPEQQWAFLPLAIYTLSTGMLGRFGNAGIVDFPKPVYAAAGLLVLVALGGLMRLIATRLRSPQPASTTIHPPPTSNPPTSDLPASSFLTVHFMLWVVHAFTVLALLASVFVFAFKYNGGATGKYLFPAFPSLALLLAAGFLAWSRPRWHPLISAALVCLNLGAALYALLGLVLPTYGPPRSPLAFELRRMTPLEADLGGVARVLGYRLDEERAEAGRVFVVRVYWLPEATTDVPYTVFVHLYQPSVGSIAQQDIYPGAGTYATTVWTPGRPFVDVYHLHVPGDAPPISGARILLGLYDEQTMQRLPVTGKDAGPPQEAWVQFGDVEVQP